MAYPDATVPGPEVQKAQHRSSVEPLEVAKFLVPALDPSCLNCACIC